MRCPNRSTAAGPMYMSQLYLPMPYISRTHLSSRRDTASSTSGHAGKHRCSAVLAAKACDELFRQVVTARTSGLMARRRSRRCPLCAPATAPSGSRAPGGMHGTPIQNGEAPLATLETLGSYCRGTESAWLASCQESIVMTCPSAPGSRACSMGVGQHEGWPAQHTCAPSTGAAI